MLLRTIAAVLLALLAPLGSGLPIYNSSFTDPAIPAEPASRKIAARAPGLQWPFDPVDGQEGFYDPTRYHYNRLAQHYNRIPPNGVKVSSHDEYEGQWPSPSQNYSPEEIYAAFRQGASILWSAQLGHINFEDYMIPYNGYPYPHELEVPEGYHLPRVPLGFGNWDISRTNPIGTPRDRQTSEIHEYPLVPGGVWPSNEHQHPGLDRVLFQVIQGVPLYVGVITYRAPLDPSEIQRNPSWGYMFNEANGRFDVRGVEGLRFPGQDTASGFYPNGYPPKRQLQNKRKNVQKSTQGVWGSDYPDGLPEPSATPQPPPGGGGGGSGTGAGAGGSGGSGYAYEAAYSVQQGGLSSGAGGSVGGSGAFGVGYYAMPLPGNDFLKNLPNIIPGPSRIQL